MKINVEFESKQELDDFFRASEAGVLAAPPSVYLVNKTGQSLGLSMTNKEDEPGAVIVSLVQRGQDADTQLIPDAAFKIV